MKVPRLMDRGQIAAEWKAALERKQGRRNVYTTYTDAEELQARLEGRTLPRVGLYAPEYRGAESASDFWDDRILERNSSWWDFPEVPVLVAIAAAARDGADAARAAVAAARQLEPAVQWCVYKNLGLWHKHADATRFGTDRIVGQVLAEYERLKLPTQDPAADTASDETADRRRKRHPWDITATEATA